MNSLTKAVIDHLQATYEVTSGEGCGKPIVLLEWQKQFIHGFLTHPTSALTIGRGNGKSSLISGLIWEMMPGNPLAEAGEIVATASSFGQARGLWSDVIHQIERDTEYRKQFRITDNANACNLAHKATGIKFRVLGSRPSGLHGIRCRALFADEPAQWPLSGGGQRMHSAIVTSTGKIAGARVCYLGTRADDPQHFFERLLSERNDRVYKQVHAASRRGKVDDKAEWLKANPSAEHWPELMAAIEGEADLAARDSSAAAPFKALRLNLGTSDVFRQPIIDLETWTKYGEREYGEMEGQPVFGIDAAASISMACVASYWPVCGSMKVLGAFPHQPSLEARERAAKKPSGLFTAMQEAGELIQCGQRVVDHRELLAAAVARFGEPLLLAGDRFKQDELLESMAAIGMNCRLETSGMGWRDGTMLVRAFRASVLEGHVRAGKSLLLRSAISDTRIEYDQAANARFSKSSNEHACRRDDAVVATCFALHHGARIRDELTARGNAPLFEFV